MGEKAYRELEREFFRLHGAGEYVQALALLEAGQNRFPEHIATIYYNRICLLALLGKHEQAWQLLHEALEQGYWYSAEWMQQDGDLASLRDQPEFEQILELCRQRHAEAQAITRPDLLVFSHDAQPEDQPLLIAMHGNTGNARNNSDPWLPLTDRGWLLALPQSSQIVGYDSYIWDDRERSTGEVREHLARLTRERAIDLQRVVLGGFSMGGGQAVWMVAQQSIATPGFVVLSPYLTEEELAALPTLLREHANAQLRGFIIVGEDDQLCLGISRQIAAIMHEQGLACELEVLPDAVHDYPSDFAEHVARGVAFVTQR